MDLQLLEVDSLVTLVGLNDTKHSRSETHPPQSCLSKWDVTAEGKSERRLETPLRGSEQYD